jgi:replicative DNA helicase Mcm
MADLFRKHWSELSDVPFRVPYKDYLLNPIVSIEPSGVKEVADLTIDGEPNFLTIGGCVHNCIDEFDKMNRDDRAAIHKAMEQQRLDVNKAGLNAMLMTRCSILAAANPKAGRWDPYGNISEQIDLPPSLLSRFDLIFIMRDVPEGDLDDKIASHILDGMDVVDGINPDLLRKYISVAKRSCSPNRSAEANEEIKRFYLRLRGLNRDGTVPITPRKLEDLKRIAEASARMRLHETADIDDAKVAVRIVEACMKEVAFDMKTGKYDIDRVISNVSGRQRADVSRVHNAMKVYGQPMSMAQIYQSCMDYLTKDQIDVAVEKMSQSAIVSISPDKTVRLV